MDFQNFIPLLLIWIFCIQFINADIDPEGRNVCFKTISKNLTVQVKYSYPIDVYTNKICLKFPFSCKTKKTEFRVGIRPENRTIQKKVASCCEGYLAEGEKCVPSCLNPCEHGGECIKPNVCDCQLGTGGLNCNATCPATKFGLNCEYDCNCLTNPHCNKNYVDCSCLPGDISNECKNICKCKSTICSPGFIGKNCEAPCPTGTFGTMCIGKCLCKEQNTLECTKDTGDCRCRPNYYGVYCEHECSGKLVCDAPNNCKCVIDSNHVMSDNTLSLKRENSGDESKNNNHGLIFSLIGLLVVTISLSMLLFYKYKVKTKKLKRDLQNIYVRYSTGASNDQFDNPVYSYSTAHMQGLPQSTYNNSLYSPSSIQTTTLPHPPKINQFNHVSLTTPRKPKQNGYLNELNNDLFVKKNQLADATNPNLMKRDGTLNSNIYTTIDEVKTIKDNYKNEFENDYKNDFNDEFSKNFDDNFKTSKETFKIPEDNDSVDLVFSQIAKKNEPVQFKPNNEFSLYDKPNDECLHYDKPKSKSPSIESTVNNKPTTYEIPKKLNDLENGYYDTLDNSVNRSYYETLNK